MLDVRSGSYSGPCGRGAGFHIAAVWKACKAPGERCRLWRAGLWRFWCQLLSSTLKISEYSEKLLMTDTDFCPCYFRCFKNKTQIKAFSMYVYMCIYKLHIDVTSSPSIPFTFFFFRELCPFILCIITCFCFSQWAFKFLEGRDFDCFLHCHMLSD